MTPALDEHGRLIPPSSKTAAVARIQQLEHESKKLEQQLSAPARFRAGEAMEHVLWSQRTNQKLGQLRSEQRQLEGFVAGWDASVKDANALFKQSYELLQLLELEIDFDASQNALMDALDRYFNKGE